MAFSEETRAKMSESKKRLFATGYVPWNKGKKCNYTEEHRKKLRDNISNSWKKLLKYGFGDRTNFTAHGYSVVKVENTNPNGPKYKYEHEHRLIAEKALGRKFKRGEIVHHIDGDKANNTNSNLLICDTSYHFWIHARMCSIYQTVMFGKVPDK